MVKIHTWTRHHQAGWTEILFTSLDTHHIITSSYWHSRSYTQPHSCMLVNAVPHTDPYTSRTSLHITSIGTSAVVRVILLHIVGWKEPHLETQEQCRSDKKTANKKKIYFLHFFRALTRPYTSPFHQPLWPFLERILMVSPSRSESSERSLAEKSYLALATPKLLMLPPVRQSPHCSMEQLKGIVLGKQSYPIPRRGVFMSVIITTHVKQS